MTSMLIGAILWTGGAIFLDLLIVMVPLHILSIITTPFSLKTWGIRKVKRWHSRTDTLANLMIWISAAFCIAAPIISYSPLIFAGWLTLSWLCALSRAVRLTKEKVLWKKRLVIFWINLIYFISLLAAGGVYNHFALWIRSFLFANEMYGGKGTDYMYYLNSVQPFAYGLQVLLMLVPLWVLWGQFKYMRLENTFKGVSITTYSIKSFFLCLLMFLAGVGGQRALEDVYQTMPENRIATNSSVYPMSRFELAVILSHAGAVEEELQTSDVPYEGEVSEESTAQDIPEESIVPESPAEPLPLEEDGTLPQDEWEERPLEGETF